MSAIGFSSQSFDVQWRKALVSLPRAVPLQFLRITSPEGPHPFLLNLPSRAKYTIPLYVFIPEKIDESRARSLPVVMDFHSGGFVLGSCLEQTPFCAKLARELKCVVVTVDYRMGPASRHPAAFEDAEDVLSMCFCRSVSSVKSRFPYSHKHASKGVFEICSPRRHFQACQ